MSTSDSESGALSQEDIAHQFVLPERQAKVNQLVKDEERYCICQSTDSTRFMICCDYCNEWYHGDCIDVTKREANDIKRFYCPICREKDPTLQIRYKSRKKITSDSGDVDFFSKHSSKSHSSSLNAKKSARRCGQCTNCDRAEDCGRCNFCKDMKKFGGSNKIRQKCRLRQCLNFGIVTGSSGVVSAPPAVVSEPVRIASAKESDKESAYTEPDEPKPPKVKKHKAHSPSRKKKRRISSSSEHEKEKRETKKHRGRKRKHKRSEIKERKNKPAKIRKEPKIIEKPHSRWRRPRKDENISSEIESDSCRQCYGPACVEPARLGSKYCSDECGIKLAKNRLCELLPPKIRQWQSSQCVAEENNKRSLERIRRQQLEARQKLQELDIRHQDLDAILEKGRNSTVDSDSDAAEMEEEGELSIYCVTCGCEISQKIALRHMEKCFNKYEAQTSFGSIYKTRIEGNSMFCDFYNPQNKTYCKRLKALCPEHCKEPKIHADEVCGCPLVDEMFHETQDICRLPKRKCSRHYCWEKLRRAEIDLQRVAQWLKLDELFEQERNTRVAMSNRMGVLGLMLHQTIDHDPLKPMCANPTLTVQ